MECKTDGTPKFKTADFGKCAVCLKGTQHVPRRSSIRVSFCKSKKERVVELRAANNPRQRSDEAIQSPALHDSMDCRAHFVRCLGFPYRSALPLVWLRQYSLRASLPGLAPFSRVVRPEIRRNDASFCVFFPRHCEERSDEAIHSTGVACLFRLPRSLRSLAMTYSFLVIARESAGRPKQSTQPASHIVIIFIM